MEAHNRWTLFATVAMAVATVLMALATIAMAVKTGEMADNAIESLNLSIKESESRREHEERMYRPQLGFSKMSGNFRVGDGPAEGVQLRNYGFGPAINVRIENAVAGQEDWEDVFLLDQVNISPNMEAGFTLTPITESFVTGKSVEGKLRVTCDDLSGDKHLFQFDFEVRYDKTAGNTYYKLTPARKLDHRAGW
ncbi:MAG: hypothetical protein WEA31_08625 [Pirellulales bacterium]